MTHLAIDPVSRVGGNLRIEVEVAGGVVSDAWSSGTVFRGIEAVLAGRDARDAWLLAQRVCGTCSGPHALASVRAVERALGVTVPRNARLVRDMLLAAGFVADHVVGFYQRHAQDWVDLGAAVRADPGRAASWAASVSNRAGVTSSTFSVARDRLAALAAGPGGPFSTLYAGHPAYRLPPEADLAILAHEIEALDWLRKVVRLQTILGGKSPHPQTFLVGGMALAPAWGGPPGAGNEHPQQVDAESPTALSERGLAEMGDLAAATRAFVQDVYLPDVLAIAAAYEDTAAVGAGLGSYLSFGEFPEDESADPSLHLPKGRVMARDLATVASVYPEGVGESLRHAWYDDGGGDAVRKPLDPAPEPRYVGPTPPFTTVAASDRYSWIKAPRFEGAPMEVGPLARLLAARIEGRRDVEAALRSALDGLSFSFDGLFGTLGRTVARAVEAKVLADRLVGWQGELVANLAKGDLAVADVSHWDPGSWPSRADGWALGESPRGAVGHWVRIADGRVERYAIVDASTWNASPRDAKGWRGPIEQALIGTPVADPARPVEILRTVHSFDPCAACAVHKFDPDGMDPLAIDVREVAP